ncbi:MAG: D-lyxose/D-mannose family sugar isomerase [Lachnospiraceae bacterium]|nr:D-lyxose/D-mannose family sugar isomerase [Lachnospiraceae bacterium]
MKRSEINRIIRDMEELAKKQGFALPPFADFAPEKWASVKAETEEIRENKLGWDVTDFGLNRFFDCGLALFTIRNGNPHDQKKYPKPYAEKLMMMYPGQYMCTHYHWYKMEDIINRGGNDLIIELWNGNEAREKLDTPVSVSCDGIRRTLPAGGAVTLHPGESMTLTPYLYHLFRVPSEGGPALIGEVSMCNDDDHDNCFFETVGRFPKIEEDEAPYRLLCTEYPS